MPPRPIVVAIGGGSRFNLQCVARDIAMLAGQGLSIVVVRAAPGPDGGDIAGLLRDSGIHSVEIGSSEACNDGHGPGSGAGRIGPMEMQPLRELLDAGVTPVLDAPAPAERVAGALAPMVGASTLVLLSSVPGLLADPDDPGSLIDVVDAQGTELARVAARGGMKDKVIAAEAALAGGVRRVVIGDARRARPVRDALTGYGTVFERLTDDRQCIARAG